MTVLRAASLVGLAIAPAAPLGEDARALRERVVFVPRGAGEGCSPQPSSELGRSPEGTWAAIPDLAFRTLRGRAWKLPVLYFTRREYDVATQRLSKEDAADVVRRRLARWSPLALEHGIDHLYRLERECLSLTAFAGGQEPLPGSALDLHFEHALRLLADLVGEGRYDSLTIAELLVLAWEGEARLLREQGALAIAAGGGAAGGGAAGGGAAGGGAAGGGHEADRAVEAIRRRLGLLSEALKRLGHPEYAGPLPYVDPERGVFVSPGDAPLIAGLRARKVPFLEWRGGVVTSWPAGKLVELAAGIREVTVLYLNAGDWLQDLEDLTRAQLDRALEERLATGRGTSRQAVADHLHSLQLEQALLRRNLLALAKREHSWLEAELREQVAQETVALRAALAAVPGWVSRPERREEALERLFAVERAAWEDAAFLAKLARHKARPELLSRFRAVFKRKERDLARASTLRSARLP